MEVNFPIASELRKITKESNKKAHELWLESIKKDIIKAAQDGWTHYNIVEGDESEIRSIFEPLGYIVELDYNIQGDRLVVIKWD